MDEVDRYDDPVDGSNEGDFVVFGEDEENTLQALIEFNGLLVKDLKDFADQFKAEKAEDKDPKIDRKDEDADMAIELVDKVLRLRMTFQNLIQSVYTVFPHQLVLDLKKVEAATCLDNLENILGPIEGDIEDLVASGGDMAELLARFPQISVKDDRPKSEVS